MADDLGAPEARGDVVERVIRYPAPLPGWGLPPVVRPDSPPPPIAVVLADGRRWRVYAPTPRLYMTLDTPRAYLDPHHAAYQTLVDVLSACIPDRPIPATGIGRREIEIIDVVTARWPSDPTRWMHLRSYVAECIAQAAPRLGLYDDLTETQRDILAGTLEIGAHGGHRRPMPEILRAAGLPTSVDSGNNKKAIAGLRNRILIVGKTGPNNGYTLTPLGYALAIAHKN